MQFVVCIKQVPGTSDVDVDENGSLIRDNVEAKMNPYDLFAIETALRLREAHGGCVSAITMGPPQAEAVLREAFMMGADYSYLLTDRKFAGSDVWATAHALSQGIKKMGDFNLVICGKQTTDGDTAQVGAEIAEFLRVPHVTNVKKILEFKNNSITVEIDLPNAVQVAEVTMPCLITVEKDIYQPRLPSFRKKLETKGRKITRLALKDLDVQDVRLYGLDGSPTKVQRVFPPEASIEQETWTGEPGDLANKLFVKLREGKFL
ncbi:MAG: electron transfer flavoprotein subunit beta/FixA family protein [Promethearchaeota archaeon]